VADRELPALLRAYRIIQVVDFPALLVGGVAAAFGRRWGAILLLANVIVQIGAHILLGTWAYRDVMTRPWPKVEPLADDAWDD
jgi:hypothetical protein